MPKYRYIGPPEHVALIDGRAVPLDEGHIVDIPDGSSPAIWEQVDDKQASQRPKKESAK